MFDRKRTGPTKGADPSRIIAALNSLHVGAMDVIRDKLGEARHACLELEQVELAERLGEATRALERADMKTYRKRVEFVIARLGHLR